MTAIADLDPVTRRQLQAAGLTDADLARMHSAEMRAQREGLPNIGDCRRAGALQAQASRRTTPARPAARVAPKAGPLQAAHDALAAMAAAFWRAQA